MTHIRSLTVVCMGALALPSLFVFAPRARADILEVEGATSCPGSGGGGLCNGNSPFDLSYLLNQVLSQPASMDNGTQKYVVTNDIGDSFSFTLEGTGQNNSGIANNGQCQVNGGASSIFDECSITDNTGQTTSLGKGQIKDMALPIEVTFSGAAALGATFDLGFVSMQGTSETLPSGGPGEFVPEPSSLALLAAGLGALAVRRYRPARGKT